jgi:RNA polymerase sigma-70 factor (ECF subfamily)
MFAELLHRYQFPLLRFLERRLEDATAAEDVLQNTFLQVHLKAGQFNPERKVRPWIYAVAAHQAIDYRRRNSRHQAVSLDLGNEDDAGCALADVVAVADERSSPPAQLDAQSKREWVKQAVSELPLLFQQVFVRVHFEGYSYLETARALGLPLGTVKSRNHTALAKLICAWQLRRGRLNTERNRTSRSYR